MIKTYYEQIESSNSVGLVQQYLQTAEFQEVEQNYANKVYQKVQVHRVANGSDVEKIAIKNILEVNKKYFHYDLFGTFEVQLLKYLPGCHYDWHCDYGVSENPKGDRKLSLSMQLSPVWDYRGGEVVVRDWHNRDHYMCSEMGNVIVFDSRAPHKVNPLTVGERCAMVAWAHGPALR